VTFECAVRDFQEKKSRSVSPVSSTTASTTSDDFSPLPVTETMQDLFLIGFSRCPREFRAGLLEGPLLRECIAAMESAGHSPELATGTKLFCKPELYCSVRKALERIEDSLRPYHVVVTDDLRPLVMEIVKGFPRALKVKCKEEAVIAKIGLSGKWMPAHQQIVPSPESEVQVNELMPKNAKAKAEADFVGVSVDTHSLALGSLLQDLPSFPVPPVPVDPALAFNPLYPSLPTLPEFDPALVMRLMQELEQHQKMLNEAFLLSMQAGQTSPDFALIAGQRH